MKTKYELIASYIEKAKGYLGTGEPNGENRSELIDKINRYIGVSLGSPYCLSSLLWLLNEIEVENGIALNLPQVAHCMTFLNACKERYPEIVTKTPQVGSIVIWNYVLTSKGHAGLVTEVRKDTIKTIEFNTAPSKEVEREGDGCYEKIRLLNPKGVMRIAGFVSVFSVPRK